MPVTLLDAWTFVDDSEPSTYSAPVSDGPNRVMVLAYSGPAHDIDAFGWTVTTVLWGDQAPTATYKYGDGTDDSCRYFALWNETAIAALTNSTIDWAASTITNDFFGYACYAGVVQDGLDSLVNDSTNYSTNQSSSTLTTTSNNGDRILAIGGLRTGNRQISDWDTLTELHDVAAATNNARYCFGEGNGGDSSTVITNTTAATPNFASIVLPQVSTAASLEIWCAQTNLPTTSTGTTDFTHGSVTTTPVAALHFFASPPPDSVWAPARFSIGATDGTTQAYSVMVSESAVALTDTNSRNGNDACLGDVGNNSSGITGLASHNSFIAGGQRINNDNGFAVGRACSSMFFAGCTASLEVATLNGTDVINVDPGFAWKAVIFFSAPRAENTGGTMGEIYFGFFDRTNQGCIAFNSDHNEAVQLGDVGLRISQTYVGMELSPNFGNIDYALTAAVGSGTSLDLTPSSTAGTDAVRCLFLGWGTGEEVTLFPWDSPTTATSDAQTGLGFQPQALINLFSQADDYDIAEATGQAGTFGIGIETAADQFCTALQNDYDHATTTFTQSTSATRAIFVEDGDGTAGFDATLTSFDTYGFTHNFTATKAAAFKQLSLAFSAATVENHVISVPKGPRRNRAV